MDRGVFMCAVAEYRMHAGNCRELANLMAKPSDKEIFERLAQAWLKLAELRKRDREPEGGGKVIHARPLALPPPKLLERSSA